MAPLPADRLDPILVAKLAARDAAFRKTMEIDVVMQQAVAKQRAEAHAFEERRERLRKIAKAQRIGQVP